MIPPSASDLQFESQRLCGNERQRHGPPLFGTVTGTRRPKGLSRARFARRRRRLKPLTDLSAGAQESLFQTMAVCASRRPPGGRASISGSCARVGGAPAQSLSTPRNEILSERCSFGRPTSSQGTRAKRDCMVNDQRSSSANVGKRPFGVRLFTMFGRTLANCASRSCSLMPDWRARSLMVCCPSADPSWPG
jgi:hypothetical protein